MKLRLERADNSIATTHWRPIQRVTLDDERISLLQLRDHLSEKALTPIDVEDPYLKGQTIKKHVIDRDSLAIMHTSMVDLARGDAPQLAPFSLIGAHCKIDPSVAVGSFTELQPRVQLNEQVAIGDRSVLLKGAIGDVSTRIGSMVFVGQDVRLGKNSEVATGTVLEKRASIGRRTSLGLQSRIHRGVTLGANVFVDASAEIGRFVHVHRDVAIGEGARIGHYAVIGRGALIGAESMVGDMSVLEPTAWIRAGEVVDLAPARFSWREFYTSMQPDA